MTEYDPELSRRIRVGESIVIANDVRITVVALGNGRVKIGIEAPGGVPVDRAEIHERKLARVNEVEVDRLLDDGGRCLEAV